MAIEHVGMHPTKDDEKFYRQCTGGHKWQIADETDITGLFALTGPDGNSVLFCMRCMVEAFENNHIGKSECVILE